MLAEILAACATEIGSYIRPFLLGGFPPSRSQQVQPAAQPALEQRLLILDTWQQPVPAYLRRRQVALRTRTPAS